MAEGAYKDREEYKDVEPIFQSEIESAVVAIAYSPKFKEVFAYLRALISKNEQSERAFVVTTDAVELNPANYTLWQYRRSLLQSLNKDLQAELNFTGYIIEDNPKNYQVWHHRRVLVEWLKDGSKELAFTERILRDDGKNYHAWQHRQWVVEEFDLWAEELNYSNRLLAEDLRNNSAWNYRYFVISSTDGYSPETLSKEVKITLGLIRKALGNESAWNYLIGILMDKEAASYEGVFDFCKELYSEKNCRTSHLLSFMADCHTELHRKAVESGDEEASKMHEEEACKLLDELVEVDPVRREYWRYLKRQFL